MSEWHIPVIPTNYDDLSVTTERESAAIVSGATDVFRLAALIRACRLLPDGRWTSAERKLSVEHVPPARPGTDEPHGARGTSVAPNFHQLLHNWNALAGKRSTLAGATLVSRPLKASDDQLLFISPKHVAEFP